MKKLTFVVQKIQQSTIEGNTNVLLNLVEAGLDGFLGISCYINHTGKRKNAEGQITVVEVGDEFTFDSEGIQFRQLKNASTGHLFWAMERKPAEVVMIPYVAPEEPKE